MIKSYLLVVKQDERSHLIAGQIKKQLNEFLIYDTKYPDLIISVGGDGTMLYALHQYFDLIDHAYFLGVHTGTLGFYTDYQADEINQLVDDIKKNEYTSFNRVILEVKVVDDKGTAFYYALNEMRLENPHYTQVLDIYINNELLETFRGNGICVSTPSGSTAYNKSLGGAVLHPDLDVMQLTEIAGIQHNAYRSLGSSIVLGKGQNVTLKSNRINGTFMGIDQLSYKLDHFKEINISLSTHVMHCIQYRPLTFVHRIRRSFISE